MMDNVVGCFGLDALYVIFYMCLQSSTCIFFPLSNSKTMQQMCSQKNMYSKVIQDLELHSIASLKKKNKKKQMDA